MKKDVITAIVIICLSAVIGITTALNVRRNETIAIQEETIEILKRSVAIYHQKLTGEPHPFYGEDTK